MTDILINTENIPDINIPFNSIENDFSRWCQHYEYHLQNMYDIFINVTGLPDKNINFDIFCEYVYINTRSTRNPGLVKYVRPLSKYL